MDDLIDKARRSPNNVAAPTISVRPVTKAALVREVPLEIRVTGPVTRMNLPIILPSHGYGPSLYLPCKGASDVSAHLTVRGADWHADHFHSEQHADCSLTLPGAKRGLGGIAGYGAKEVDDEGPDRQATTRRMSWAQLRSALYHGDPAWANACEALRSEASSLGRVDTGGALHGHEIPALGHVPRRDLGGNTGD